MLLRLSACTLVLLLAACGGIKFPPQPPPPPPPEAPSPVCLPGHGDPGEHYSCWTNPPDEGWVYVCPWYDETGTVVGTQNVGDPALCPAKPEATECRFPQGLPDSAFAPVQNVENVFHAQVNAALAKVSGCDAGRCLVFGGPQAFFAKVTAELRAQGLCAGQHIEGVTDEIAVAVPGSGKAGTHVWYGYHGYAGDDSNLPTTKGTVLFSPQAFTGAYAVTTGGGAPPPPQGDRPECSGCGDPWPPDFTVCNVKLWDIGGYLTDSVCKIKDAAYCQAVDFTGGSAGVCPARLECGEDGHLPDGTECKWKDRPACEQCAAHGDVRWTCDNGPAEAKPGNPWRARCAKAGATSITLCVNHGAVCETLEL